MTENGGDIVARLENLATKMSLATGARTSTPRYHRGPRAMHHYGVFRRLLGCGAGEDEAWLSGARSNVRGARKLTLWCIEAAVAAALREAINRVSGCDRISEVQPAILALIRERGE
jgi:hypothetical protein